MVDNVLFICVIVEYFFGDFFVDVFNSFENIFIGVMFFIVVM